MQRYIVLIPVFAIIATAVYSLPGILEPHRLQISVFGYTPDAVPFYLTVGVIFGAMLANWFASATSWLPRQRGEERS